MLSTVRFIATALFVLTGVWAESAAAQTPQQLKWCNGDEATPDLQINGCTALIQSGKFSGKALALIFTARGIAYRNKGQYELAITDFNQAIQIEPKLVNAWVQKCRTDNAKDDRDSAIADCSAALNLDPKNGSAWTYRGDAYSHKKDFDRAIHDFTEAVKFSPEWMWPYNDRGELYLDRGNYDLAIQDFDKVIRLSDTYTMGWNNRCRALAIVGRLDQALNDCNQALKLNPKFINYMVISGNVSAIQHRGFVHLKAGRFAAAIEDFDKALELTPKSAEVLYGRGVAKQKNGDAGGGDADIAAAKEIQSDIAEKYARYGVK